MKILIVISLILVNQCSCMSDSGGRQKCIKEKKMSEHIIVKNPEEFWNNPDKILSIYASEKIWESDLLTIDCPDFIPITMRQEFPMLLFSRRSTALNFHFPFKERCCIVITDIELNKTTLGPPFLSEKISTKKPEGYSPGEVGTSKVIDLRKTQNISWETASYMVTVIYMDKVSNRCKVQLTAVEENHKTAEDEKLLYKRQLAVPRRLPGPHLNKEIIYKEKPVGELKEPGVKIHGGNAVFKHTAESHFVEVDYLLPVRNMDAEPMAFKDDKTLFAVVPITILVIGTVDGESRVERTFNAPSYLPTISIDNKLFASGSFRIDLTKLAEISIKPGNSYYVYVFSDVYIAGPGIFKSESDISGQEPGYVIPTPVSPVPVRPK